MNFMAPFLRAQSYKCDTPLIAAIHARDINGAKKLIDSGVELNAKDCGTTPLIESIASHQPAIAEKLILAGQVQLSAIPKTPCFMVLRTENSCPASRPWSRRKCRR
jgi:hypothetical protein